MPEIRRSEITLVFAHYDYFTGRAVRIVLNMEPTRENLEAAFQCLAIAKREKVGYASKYAQKIADDAYHTWHGRATDLQLKVLHALASTKAQKLQDALGDILDRELKSAQTMLTV